MGSVQQVAVGIGCPGGVGNWAAGDGIQKPKVQLKQKLLKDVNINKKGSTDTLEANVEPDEFKGAERAGHYNYKTTLSYL